MDEITRHYLEQDRIDRRLAELTTTHDITLAEARRQFALWIATQSEPPAEAVKRFMVVTPGKTDEETLASLTMMDVYRRGYVYGTRRREWDAPWLKAEYTIQHAEIFARADALGVHAHLPYQLPESDFPLWIAGWIDGYQQKTPRF